MWNPCAAGLIALKAAVNILKAKLDEMMVRMVEIATDGGVCSSNDADTSPAQTLRLMRWAAIGDPHHRAPPPDILANVDDQSLETYDRVLYVMGCPNTRELSREFGIPMWKIGTCHDLRLGRREDE